MPSKAAQIAAIFGQLAAAVAPQTAGGRIGHSLAGINQAMIQADIEKEAKEEAEKKSKGLFGGSIGGAIGGVAGIALAPFTGGASLAIAGALGAGIGSAAGQAAFGGGDIDIGQVGLSAAGGALAGGIAGAIPAGAATGASSSANALNIAGGAVPQGVMAAPIASQSAAGIAGFSNTIGAGGIAATQAAQAGGGLLGGGGFLGTGLHGVGNTPLTRAASGVFQAQSFMKAFGPSNFRQPRNMNMFGTPPLNMIRDPNDPNRFGFGGF